MLRRKHRVGNLKQEREKIARYLQSFLSRVRDPEPREPGKGDDAATESAAISGSANKGAVEDAKGKALATTAASVAIGLVALDAPGPSKVRSSKNRSVDRTSRSRKTTRDKTTQMRKNLSTQSLRANEEINDDDDDDDEDDEDDCAPRGKLQRPKYILIGWDSFRSRLMLLLMVLFLLWIAIYFPLIGS